MEKLERKVKLGYACPRTQVRRVSVEASVCAGSEVTKIKAENPNVEVDEWDSIENYVTFD